MIFGEEKERTSELNHRDILKSGGRPEVDVIDNSEWWKEVYRGGLQGRQHLTWVWSMIKN